MLLTALPLDAFAQTPLPKQIPTPKPSLTKTASAPTPELWFQDPRWWGIGATGFLSVAGLLLQWRYRSSDKKNDAASGHFDGDIRDPIKDSYKELRTLANLAAVA